MGSKLALLRGDLGQTLLRESKGSKRFVDLFSGSGSVSHFMAESTDLPVLSVDLQEYSSILSGCITERDSSVVDSPVVTSWVKNAALALAGDSVFSKLARDGSLLDKKAVVRARTISSASDSRLFITRHYGGHYFSPQQAYTLDLLHSTLPADQEQRTVGLAALLRTASICAASPGHTAQPFQPTDNLLPSIERSWARDVLLECQRQLDLLSKRHARTKGAVLVGEAVSVANTLNSDDLVFCDPPYSAVQYSRFYHVLEGIARGGWPEVVGAGRSPDSALRESSSFSLKSRASEAMADLLQALRRQSCRVVITFPDLEASNGLSGQDIVEIASKEWRVSAQHVNSIHSTLGGSGGANSRGGRKSLQEIVLLLKPDGSEFSSSLAAKGVNRQLTGTESLAEIKVGSTTAMPLS